MKTSRELNILLICLHMQDLLKVNIQLKQISGGHDGSYVAQPGTNNTKHTTPSDVEIRLVVRLLGSTRS